MRIQGGGGGGSGGTPPSALSGMDRVLVQGGVGADPIVPPFQGDIAVTSVGAITNDWVDPTIGGNYVGITQPGIYLFSGVFGLNDFTSDMTGIVRVGIDWGAHTDLPGFTWTFLDLAKTNQVPLTSLFYVNPGADGHVGVLASIPSDVDTLSWFWQASIVRLGSFA